MNDMFMGEFTGKLIDNGVVLPEKFLVSGTTLDMVVLQDGNYRSIQLWKELNEESLQMAQIEGVEIMLHQKVEIPENGFFKLPEAFLEQISDAEHVIIAGVCECIEILSAEEWGELEAQMNEFETLFAELEI